MNTKNVGETVKFKLDGKRDGEGVILSTNEEGYIVKLTAPCKEFEEGLNIIVFEDEIVWFGTNTMKSKLFTVFDTGNSCVIGEYKHLSSAKRRRNKELSTRKLPAYFIIIRLPDGNCLTF